MSPSSLIFIMKTKKTINNKGFSLIELIVAVAVVAILSAAAITVYTGSALKARRAEAYSNLSALRMFQEQFFAENTTYAPNLDSFPGFDPDNVGATSQYTYLIESITDALPAGAPSIPYDGNTVAQDPCFVITATGIANTTVAADIFVIDCNNNKNF